MEQQGDPTSQPTITIATQTGDTSNIGQGRHPLAEKQHFSLFADSDYDNSPDYIKHSHEAFGEKLIAEATRSDPQSKKLLQMIEQKD